jgi:hypothetical protein
MPIRLYGTITSAKVEQQRVPHLKNLANRSYKVGLDAFLQDIDKKMAQSDCVEYIEIFARCLSYEGHEVNPKITNY